MANSLEQTATGKQSFIGYWPKWLSWGGSGTQLDNNNGTGFAAEAAAAVAAVETKKKPEKFSDENEGSPAEELLHTQNLAVDSRPAETTTYASNLANPISTLFVESKPKNIVVSQEIYAWMDRSRLAKSGVNFNPETDNTRETMADDDDAATSLQDWKTTAYSTDLESTTMKDIVITKLKQDNFNLTKELALLKERQFKIMEGMELMKGTNKAAAVAQYQQTAKPEWVDDADELTKTSATEHVCGCKKEEEIFVKKEIWMLRDHNSSMEQKIKALNELVSAHNFKLNQTVERLQVSSSRANTNYLSEAEAMYKRLNNRMDKLENTVHALKSEKRSLIQANKKMAKEISSNTRKHAAARKSFNAFRVQMKKELTDVKTLLHSTEINRNMNNMNTENTARRKYDKLKIRLSAVEKAEMTNQIKSEQMLQNMMVMTSCAYLRAGQNGSVTNVNNYDAKDQQPHSPAHSMSPVTPVPTSVPPTIPFQPPASPAAGPQAQYPRYTIDADQLKEMAKKLRKPDKDNISKIPKRKDMKIPSRDANTVEPEVPLPPPAPPLPSLAPEEIFVVPLERPEPPEFPSTLPTPKASVESLVSSSSWNMD